MSGNISDEEFLHVLDEMTQICGEDEPLKQSTDLAEIVDSDFLLDNGAKDEELNFSSRNDLDLLSCLSPSSGAPLVEDQLLSSTSTRHSGFTRTTKRSVSEYNHHDNQTEAPVRKRSRNSSANSGGSYDSAIGDIYYIGTPHSTLDLERELLELTSVSCDNTPVTVSCRVSPIADRQSQNGEILSYTISIKDVSETCRPTISVPEPVKKKKSVSHDRQKSQPYRFRDFAHNEKRGDFTIRPASTSSLPVQPMAAGYRAAPAATGRGNWQQELKDLCRDLLNRYGQALYVHPMKKVANASYFGEDPLGVTTRLLSDSLARLRIFLFNLESVHWLTYSDRNTLYNANVCSLTIIKAGFCVNLDTVPQAYPLPCGENLNEIEALHLIMAHDLFNELRALLTQFKSLGITEFPFVLLVMLVAFFTPNLPMQHPQKVLKAHDFYMQKLQMYVFLRHGPDMMPRVMTALFETVHNIRNFSTRLREFMKDVTRCGLQNQFESVCENIGLIALTLQSEPRTF